MNAWPASTVAASPKMVSNAIPAELFAWFSAAAHCSRGMVDHLEDLGLQGQELQLEGGQVGAVRGARR